MNYTAGLQKLIDLDWDGSNVEFFCSGEWLLLTGDHLFRWSTYPLRLIKSEVEKRSRCMVIDWREPEEDEWHWESGCVYCSRKSGPIGPRWILKIGGVK